MFQTDAQYKCKGSLLFSLFRALICFMPTHPNFTPAHPNVMPCSSESHAMLVQKSCHACPNVMPCSSECHAMLVQISRHARPNVTPCSSKRPTFFISWFSVPVDCLPLPERNVQLEKMTMTRSSPLAIADDSSERASERPLWNRYSVSMTFLDVSTPVLIPLRRRFPLSSFALHTLVSL